MRMNYHLLKTFSIQPNSKEQPNIPPPPQQQTKTAILKKASTYISIVILPPNLHSKISINSQKNPGTLDENKKSKVHTIKYIYLFIIHVMCVKLYIYMYLHSAKRRMR